MRPRLLPTSHGAVRGAAPDRLLEITGTTGISEPPAHRKSAINDRETMCPSECKRLLSDLVVLPPQDKRSHSLLKRCSFFCRKLSAEEMELKRKEMMDQAKQREEDRENNVKRYKRQDEQEKQRERNAKYDRHAGFIQ